MLPAKWRPGFSTDEALNLAAVCSNLNGPVSDAPQPAMPGNWSMVTTIKTGIYDNEAWLLRNTSRHASMAPQLCLAFRGTMDNPLSIWEDADLEMVPAVNYSNRAQSMIHQGFKKGIESLLPDIQHAINPILEAAKVAKERVEVYVTGHSQGAALAALFTSWVRCSGFANAPYMRMKSYYFAQPKPGNDYFADDFNERHCFAKAYDNASWAYRVSNDQDFVPQMPLTIELPDDLNPRFKVFEKSPQFPKILRELVAFLEGIRLPVVGTQNYAGVGTLVALKGKRDLSKDPDDFFYQHHCGRYWELIGEQLRSSQAELREEIAHA